MRFLDKPLWLCLVRTDKCQGFDVFFDGTCPITTSYVREFLKCPAAQVMHWLLRRGFVKADVEAFLTRIFNTAQLALCRNAKWNPDIKLSQVKTMSGDMDIVTASRRKDTFINPDLGLSAERIALRKAKMASTECRLGLYDFSRPQDLRSLHGDGESAADFSVDGSPAASIYRIKNGSTVDEEEDEETVEEDVDGDDEETDSQRKVQFDMLLPSGETSEKLLLPAARQGVSSLRKSTYNSSVGQLASEEEEEEEVPNIVSYRRFATDLWSRAPEDYPTLFAILDTLEHEHVTALHGAALDTLDGPSVDHLIDGELRRLLVAAAREEEVLEFIAEMRMLMQESQENDIEAQEIIESSLYGDTEVGFVDAEDGMDNSPDGEAISPEGDLDSHGNRLASPARDVMQVDGPVNDRVNPQGSLLPAPVENATAFSGDVETARPGGTPG
jgi:hypothetical protein